MIFAGSPRLILPISLPDLLCLCHPCRQVEAFYVLGAFLGILLVFAFWETFVMCAGAGRPEIEKYSAFVLIFTWCCSMRGKGASALEKLAHNASRAAGEEEEERKNEEEGEEEGVLDGDAVLRKLQNAISEVRYDAEVS